MASRREQKEQARAARLARERELATKTQRRRRMQVFGGIIAIAVIVIVVAIVVSAGGGNSAETGLKTGPAANRTANAVQTMFKGIPQQGATLGNPSAKVTLQYFGDLECPFCQQFTLHSLPTFIQDYVRTGQAKVEYKAFCTATCNNNTASNPGALFTKQQVAALAAGQQGKFWQYADLFYRQQGQEDTPYVTEDYLHRLATQVVGLNLAQWQTDRGNPNLAKQLTADNSLTQRYGIQGTPTLVMLGPKSKEIVPSSGVDGVSGIPSPNDLATAFKAVT